MAARFYLTCALLCTTACNNDLDSSGFPKPVDELTVEDLPESERKAIENWKNLAAYMGFSDGASSAIDLQVALGTAPTSYSPGGSNNVTIAAGVATKVLGNALATQCAEVSGITPGYRAKKVSDDGTSLIDLVSPPGGDSLATVHTIRYRLYSNAGVKDPVARTALVVVPKDGSKTYPLIMYAHGGAAGLEYQEVAKLFGEAQANYIIAAPTFPGEPLCDEVDQASLACKNGTPLMAGLGSPSIYDGDVIEYLGLHNCLAQLFDSSLTFAKLDPSTLEPTTGIIANPWGGKLKTITTQAITKVLQDMGSSVDVKTPYTLALGAGRGGKVAQLAVARSGIFLADIATFDANQSFIQQAAQAIKSSTSNAVDIRFRPMFASAVGAAFSGFSETMGTQRLALEAAVKGLIKNTSFYQIPGMAILASLYSRLENDKDNSITKEDMAAEIAMRDLVFMSQYMAVGLRDWGGAEDGQKAGQIALLHGVADKVAPYVQSIFAFNTYKTVNAGASANNLPGFSYGLYAFQPPETFYNDGVFQADTTTADYNHGAVPSFLQGTLASLSEEHKAIVKGAATGDATLNTMAANLSAALIAAAKAAIGTPTAAQSQVIEATYSEGNVKAVLYPLLNTPSEAYGQALADLGHHADAEGLYGMTPLPAFGIWLASLAATQTQAKP